MEVAVGELKEVGGGCLGEGVAELHCSLLEVS